MNVEKIEEFLALRSIMPVARLFMDENYQCPTERWVLGPFSDAFLKFLQILDVNGYKPEAFDCDDFARAAAFFAGVCHVKTEGRKVAALAFNKFLFQSKSGPHCLNIVFTNEQDGGIMYYEPQTRTKAELASAEEQSCFGYVI